MEKAQYVARKREVDIGHARRYDADAPKRADRGDVAINAHLAAKLTGSFPYVFFRFPPGELWAKLKEVSHRSPSEGHVSQRSDGRWQASLEINGVRKVVYGKREKEARKKLAELMKELVLMRMDIKSGAKGWPMPSPA